jgi:anti-anti-sigma factor
MRIWLMTQPTVPFWGGWPMSVGFSEQGAYGGALWFNASLCFTPDRLVVCLSGDLDLGSDVEIQALFDKIAGLEAPVTVVDLSEVTFIDAHGIGLIVAAYKSAVERGRVLKVAGLHGLVAQVFSLTHLEALVLTEAEAHDREGDAGGRG